MAETRLIAVNQMLDSIGEKRVNSLGSNTGDSALAEQILDEVNREVQSLGWFANTLNNVTLEIDSENDELIVPANTLRIEPIRGQTPVILVGNRAMDKLTNTFKFTTTVTANIITFRPFEDIHFSIRVYITKLAAKKFHRSTLGSVKIDGFSKDDVAEALALARLDDAGPSRRNILTDNFTSRNIINRDRGNLRAQDFRFPTSQTLPPIAP